MTIQLAKTIDSLKQACKTYGPRELSQLQKMLQQPDFGYIINCHSKIYFKLQQNELDFATRGKFMLVNLALRRWAQFGGGHGGRVPHIFRRGGHNMLCSPTFFSQVLYLERFQN